MFQHFSECSTSPPGSENHRSRRGIVLLDAEESSEALSAAESGASEDRPGLYAIPSVDKMTRTPSTSRKSRFLFTSGRNISPLGRSDAKKVDICGWRGQKRSLEDLTLLTVWKVKAIGTIKHFNLSPPKDALVRMVSLLLAFLIRLARSFQPPLLSSSRQGSRDEDSEESEGSKRRCAKLLANPKFEAPTTERPLAVFGECRARIRIHRAAMLYITNSTSNNIQ